MSKLVDRVGEEIRRVVNETADANVSFAWDAAARAAIAAMRKPDRKMLVAAVEEADDEHNFGAAEARGCWTSMIDEALK